MYIKGLFETFRILGKLGIKPKDVIGLGGDVVKMGKSLFNTRVNPKLLQFVEKNQKIPTKIIEEIKIHARTLKNASENQKKLFEVNIRDILNAKTPKIPVSSVKQPVTSVKDAAEAFKGWKPTVIKGGKDKLADGGITRLPFENGTEIDSDIKKMSNIFVEDQTITDTAGKKLEEIGSEQAKLLYETKPTRNKFLPGQQGDKEYQLALDAYYETEKGKKEKEDEMFKMVKEFQTFKRDNPESRMTFWGFVEKKKKEKELFKNTIIKLDLKYPEKEIIDKETNMVNTENLKSAIDEAEASLEISPIDGLILKRSIDTEGDQSVTSGSFSLDNLTFSSPNIEEGELTTTGSFDVGNLNLIGTVDTKDSDVLSSGIGFNYDDILKGKFSESDGYKEAEFDLDKTFPINDKFDLNLKGESDIAITPDGETYKSSDLTPKLSYDDGTFSADVSKEIMEGGDKPNLGLGVNYNDFYLKGDNLLSPDRTGVAGYQKEFGDRDGDLFFTAGAEKNLFDDEWTSGVGVKLKYADGGIATHFRKK